MHELLAFGLDVPISKKVVERYRTYSENDLRVLRMIKQSYHSGFALDQIRELLSWWSDPSRVSADVKAIAQVHINNLDNRIAEPSESG